MRNIMCKIATVLYLRITLLPEESSVWREHFFPALCHLLTRQYVLKCLQSQVAEVGRLHNSVPASTSSPAEFNFIINLLQHLQLYYYTNFVIYFKTLPFYTVLTSNKFYILVDTRLYNRQMETPSEMRTHRKLLPFECTRRVAVAYIRHVIFKSC